MGMSKLDEFVNHLKWHSAGNKSIYLWGGQGQSLENGLSEAKIRKMETSEENAKIVIDMWKKHRSIPGARAFDCSGLGCYLMEVVGVVPKGFDATAEGLRQNCTKIKRNEVRKGCWVFRLSGSKAVHIGYVVDDAGNVVEAQGRKYGVVERPFEKGYWEWYGIPKWFKSEIENHADERWTCSRVLKLTEPYMEGEDVKNVQSTLKSLGYVLNTVTGKYGTQTESAVKSFQRLNKLTVDGKCGANTITRLGGKWNG